jgi:hypothetical protein
MPNPSAYKPHLRGNGGTTSSTDLFSRVAPSPSYERMPTQRTNSGFDWVTPLVNGLNNANNYQPPPQPIYRQPQYNNNYYTPTPQQPVYRPQPQVNVPSNMLPPQNVLPPQNTIPEEPEATPEENYAQTGIEPLSEGLNLTQDEADAISADLQNQIGEKFQRYEDEQQNIQQNLDDFKANLENNVPDPIKRARIEEAINEHDPEKLKQAMINAGPPVSDLAAVAAADVNTYNQIENLKNVMQNGGSAAEIAQASTAVVNAEHDSVIEQSKAFPNSITVAQADDYLKSTAKTANDIVALKAADEVVQSSMQGTLSVPGGTLPLPTDDLIAVWYPGLDPGMTAAVGQNMVFLGTGDGGAMTSAYVCPAEAGLPVVSGDLVPSSRNPNQDPSVIITNPDSNAGSISYVINNDLEKLEPGQSQELPAGNWTIKFDRGGGNGQETYALEEGYYEFAIGDNGWDLSSTEQIVNLDNSANPYDFKFLLNDETSVVPAREALEITSSAPIVVKFDDGTGKANRKLLKTGDYSIAVNPASRQLDIFEGWALPEEPAEVEPRQSGLSLASVDTNGRYRRVASYNSNAISKSDLPTPKVVQPPRRRVAPRPVTLNTASTIKWDGPQDAQFDFQGGNLVNPETGEIIELKPGETFQETPLE